ncbi:hypothetical protein HJC23_005437 [Cyclotella cryptica]|uniref:Uncharacterized protein n=1 Tax=Cyclotella cryptica TaxID=29204 RepID=A0ABD3P3N7_9STRA|eukprot:CCRYP_017904-RA/>CCRYP_017904-RA protein AED:0.12 eAED:0.12 QI:0/-1/0/1/-1/1/1/0/628
MNNPTNGNLRALGLSLNLPFPQPSLSQQGGHTSVYASQDDGYYYDAGAEPFDGEENYYDYNDEGYSDDGASLNGGQMTMWQDPWEMDAGNSLVEGGADWKSGGTIDHDGTIAEQAEAGGEENANNHSAGSASSRPVIHPALIDALKKHAGKDTPENVSGSVVSSASHAEDVDASSIGEEEENNTVMTTNINDNSLLDNSVSNLLITSPIKGEEQAILEEKQEEEDGSNGLQNNNALDESNLDKNDTEEVSGMKEDENLDGNKVELMSAEFESIVPPPDLNQPGGATVTGELNETGDINPEEDELFREGHVTGEIKEAEFPDTVDERVNVEGAEGIDTFDEQSEEEGMESKPIVFPDEEEPMSQEVEIGEEESAESLDIGEDVDDQDHHFGSMARDSAIDLEIEADLNDKEDNSQEDVVSSGTENAAEDLEGEDEEQTEQIDIEDNAQSNSPSTAEIEQGNEIHDESDESSFKGFDEDFSSGHIDISQHEQPPDASESNIATNAQDNNDYTGDGFTYHVLQPKSRSHGTASSISSYAIATVVGILLCFCCIRYKRRYGRHSRPNRGKYSAIGGNDFFNGTFSDDISFNGKDSDDDMSFGSDDGDGIRIELGGIHETDANGGLTLEEING